MTSWAYLPSGHERPRLCGADPGSIGTKGYGDYGATCRIGDELAVDDSIKPIVSEPVS